jgi:hypothetical protein
MTNLDAFIFGEIPVVFTASNGRFEAQACLDPRKVEYSSADVANLVGVSMLKGEDSVNNTLKILEHSLKKYQDIQSGFQFFKQKQSNVIKIGDSRGSNEVERYFMA